MYSQTRGTTKQQHQQQPHQQHPTFAIDVETMYEITTALATPTKTTNDNINIIISLDFTRQKQHTNFTT